MTRRQDLFYAEEVLYRGVCGVFNDPAVIRGGGSAASSRTEYLASRRGHGE